MTHNFKDSIFSINEEKLFNIILLGKSDSNIQENFTNAEIFSQWDLNYIDLIPDESDQPGIYKGDFIVSFDKNYLGEYNELIEIDNLIKLEI